MFFHCSLTLGTFVQPGDATGVLYEDDGDGFGYKNGDYLITHYEARTVQAADTKHGKIMIRVASTEGRRERPKRTLHVRLLVGENVQVFLMLLILSSIPL